MSEVTRRQFLKQMGGLIVPVALSSSSTVGAPGLGKSLAAADETPRRKPNIIFIMADDLGYGDLGCYGQQQIRTPHIDRIAKEGVRFSDCYSGATVCAPSRCTLMTGQHTGHCWVRGNKSRATHDRVPLRPEDTTVAQLLKEAGYATGIVGKWGLGEPGTTGIPNRKGFDYWFGYLNQARAHEYYTDYLWRNEEKVNLPPGTYSHDLFTEEALDFIRREKDKPFFLYVAYTIPHAEIEVPSEDPYADEPWSENARKFAAMITRMDGDVGRMMGLLRRLGIDDNTIVFFTSDNGPHSEGGHDARTFKSSGPLRGIKRDLYEGGIRVPMIVRWPGKIAPGRTSGQPWAFWDFLPTAVAIAAAKPPDGIDGISMLPAILGRKQKHDHEYLYWEFHEGGVKQALRFGNWKAVRNKQGKPIELYDLKTDLGEQHDLSAQHRDLVKKAEELMKSAHVPSKDWPDEG
jgi:arylsulfatase A